MIQISNRIGGQQYVNTTRSDEATVLAEEIKRVHEDSGRKHPGLTPSHASKDKVLKGIFSRIKQEEENPKRILASAGSVHMSEKEQRRKRKTIPQSRSTGDHQRANQVARQDIDDIYQLLIGGHEDEASVRNIISQGEVHGEDWQQDMNIHLQTLSAESNPSLHGQGGHPLNDISLRLHYHHNRMSQILNQHEELESIHV